MKIILSMLALTFQLIGAEELSKAKPKQIEAVTIQRKLATLDKGKSSIKNAKKVIQLLQFNLHRQDAKTIEQGVPAVGYILRSYDKDLLPLLVDYALLVENRYLKRRAVYCAEQLYSGSIKGYFESKFGEDAKSKKLDLLVEESKHGLLLEAEALKKAGNFGEYSLLLVKHVDCFFPKMSDALLNLKIPGE